MPELLKDRFFTPNSLRDFGEAIKKHHIDFDVDVFLSSVQSGVWSSLELKARMRHVTIHIHKQLPQSYEKAITILMETASDAKGFEAMALPDYAELYGLDYWDISMAALKRFTRFSSSEFAIRPFLIQNLEGAMKMVSECADDEHENVRRFASEGCRPRLPWAMAVPALKKDPTPILPILEKLKDDSSEFVRRSVANNLNDISKEHLETALEVAGRWLGTSEETDKLVKHAMRTLLKAGNTRAMRLFGFGDPKNIGIENFTLGQDTITIDETTNFSLDLIVNETEPSIIRVEFAMFYVKANGKLSKKVFKLREKEYEPGSYHIVRKYGFVNMSTRKIYPGEHFISIIVNGIEKAKQRIEVL